MGLIDFRISLMLFLSFGLLPKALSNEWKDVPVLFRGEKVGKASYSFREQGKSGYLFTGSAQLPLAKLIQSQIPDWVPIGDAAVRKAQETLLPPEMRNATVDIYSYGTIDLYFQIVDLNVRKLGQNIRYIARDGYLEKRTKTVFYRFPSPTPTPIEKIKSKRNLSPPPSIMEEKEAIEKLECKTAPIPLQALGFYIEHHLDKIRTEGATELEILNEQDEKIVHGKLIFINTPGKSPSFEKIRVEAKIPHSIMYSFNAHNQLSVIHDLKAGFRVERP